ATAAGYAHHFYRQHKSTLKAHGIYLLCACGNEKLNTSTQTTVSVMAYNFPFTSYMKRLIRPFSVSCARSIQRLHLHTFIISMSTTNQV
ncbi:hypothetical protein PENTCL1PPCAC_1422, partial [Pristionchus entomophagus]